MSLYTDIARLDPENREHAALVVILAKTKARHDALRQVKHRKDPSLFQALVEYRKARQDVRQAGEEFTNGTKVDDRD